MKIIEQGKDMKKPEKPWWVGKTIRCKQCGCTFTLDEGDTVKVLVHIDVMTGQRRHGSCKIKCPNETCQADLRFYAPDKGTKGLAEELDRSLEEMNRIQCKLNAISDDAWTIFDL